MNCTRCPLNYLQEYSTLDVLVLSLVRLSGSKGITSHEICTKLHGKTSLRNVQISLKRLQKAKLVRRGRFDAYLIGEAFTSEGVANNHACRMEVPLPLDSLLSSGVQIRSIGLYAYLLWFGGVHFTKNGKVSAALRSIDRNTWRGFSVTADLATKRKTIASLRDLEEKGWITREGRFGYRLRLTASANDFVEKQIEKNHENEKNALHNKNTINTIFLSLESSPDSVSRKEPEQQFKQYVEKKHIKKIRLLLQEFLPECKNLINTCGRMFAKYITSLASISFNKLCNIVKRASVLSHPYAYFKRALINRKPTSPSTLEAIMGAISQSVTSDSATIYALSHLIARSREHRHIRLELRKIYAEYDCAITNRSIITLAKEFMDTNAHIGNLPALIRSYCRYLTMLCDRFRDMYSDNESKHYISNDTILACYKERVYEDKHLNYADLDYLCQVKGYPRSVIALTEAAALDAGADLIKRPSVRGAIPVYDKTKKPMTNADTLLQRCYKLTFFYD